MEYNANDEQQVSDASKKVEIERMQLIEDYRAILKTPAGMRFFKYFLSVGKLFTTGFTGNSHTFFNLGRKDIAYQIFNDIVEAAPDKVTDLLITEDRGTGKGHVH